MNNNNIHMEKRIIEKHNEFMKQYKKALSNKIDEIMNEASDKNKQKLESLQQFMYDYDSTIYTSADFEKKKRIRNVVKPDERCKAYRANGQQCTRRHKEGYNYCGTHIKGLPHGHVDVSENKEQKKTIKVWQEEINGISYYIDNNNNVYDTYDIIESVETPKIISKYKTMFDDKANKTIFILDSL